MPKCLYNGVPLPVLPDWDKAAYPCAYIVAGAWVDGRYSGGYALIACETECIVSRANDGSICFGSLGSKYELYSLDEAVTAWEYENVFSFTGYLLASPVWVNVNAYYDADNGGTLYLAASEPIPVGATPDIDPTSMFMGWLTGRRIAGQRGKKVQHTHEYASVITEPTCTEKGYITYNCSVCSNSYKEDYVDALGHDYVSEVIDPTTESEGYTLHTCSRCGDSYEDNYTDKLQGVPIAYLYNGYELPALPMDITSTYPYALIKRTSGLYTLYICKSLYVGVKFSVNQLIYTDAYIYKLTDGSSDWVLNSSGSNGSFSAIDETYRWSNVDILDSSGSVYFSGSEPVPVYE